jgi:Fanconi-associated nuclease 1
MSLLDYWDPQRLPAKRRKTAKDGLSAPSPGRDDGADTPSRPLDADPDDQGSPDEPPSSQTDLEASLPAIQSGSEAIETYETSQADDAHDLHERLGDGKWQAEKSSIYVDAFNLALETVLGEEAHLFSEAEIEVFRQWKELSYESQYLYGLPGYV